MAKKTARDAGGTPATLALAKAGITYTTHTYDRDDDHGRADAGFGAEAAAKLGVDPGRIFRTLVVGTGEALAVAVAPVAHQLDLKATAAALGVKKVALAEPSAAERSSGYVVGGISPIAQRTPLATVIDSSAQDFGLIMVSAGRRGLQLELSPNDLAATTSARFAAIARR